MQTETEKTTAGTEDTTIGEKAGTTAPEKKKRSLSPLLRTLLFLIVLCLLAVYMLNVFDMKDDKGAEKVFRTFYLEKNNTLDGIYIGSSSAYRFWIPPYAYENSGMAISNLGTGSQPVVLQKYIISEALKTQSSMKVIVIDIRSMLNDDKRLKEADIRRVTDSFPVMDPWYFPSRNRIRAINTSLEYFDSQEAKIEYTKWYYYFPFLKYHNRWQSDITPKDLTGLKYKNRFKGFVFTSSGSLSVKKLEPPSYTSEKAGISDPAKKEVLRDLIAYCKRLDQKVVFVSAPYRISEEEQEQLNTYSEQITEAGFPVLNFNTPETMELPGLDWQTDFMDPKHVNVYGAMKYTACIMNYLKEQVEWTDHRGDDTYLSWDKAALRFHKKLERLEALKAEGQLQLNSDE